MNLSWTYYFFVAIPEATASTIFALTFLKQPLLWKNVLKVGILYATAAFIVHNLPISFGIHIVILINVFAILLANLAKCKLTSTYLVSLINMVILGIAEIFSGPLLMKLLNVTYEVVQNDEWLLVIFVLPQIILLITLAFIFRKHNLNKGRSHEVNP